MPYRIDTLHVGTLLVRNVTEPVYAWLVRGEGRTVLVDAGTPEPGVVRARWGSECDRGGPGVLRAELERCGSAPGEIDTLVLTHLHFDHVANLDLFPAAQVVVQRAEIIHAIDPVPTQRGYYSRELNAALVGRRKPDELLIVAGDHTLAPGLELLLLPGHTPGIMGVVVETERGRVGLASDVGETYANWYPVDPRATSEPVAFLADSFLPPWILSEGILTAIAGLARLRAACDIVVPAHDWRIPRALPGDWWELPPAGRGGQSALAGRNW